MEHTTRDNPPRTPPFTLPPQTSKFDYGKMAGKAAAAAGDALPPSSLHVPHSRLRQRSPSPHGSLISVDDFSELRRAVSTASSIASSSAGPDAAKRSTPLRGWRGRVQRSWVRNKGLAFVLAAQVFGTAMNIGTRLLENLGESGEAGEGMHPFQILFARMSITFLLSMLYMWYTRTPDFPFGAKGVRWILVARGVGGFFGVYGIYCSLQYLPLGDATVLTFIAPFIACAVCAKLLHEPFTRVDQIGGLVSLIGVVLIAQPTTIFAGNFQATEGDGAGAASNASRDVASATNAGFVTAPEATAAQRLYAVGMAMVGVVGAAIAYVTIRWIGTRAHPLISVNYFATWCTIVSATALAFVPSVPFLLPRNVREWGLLGLIGVGGFVMQFLLTAGLRYERSSRATNMVYSQMLFALLADRVIWGEVPSTWSLAGSALILGAALVVALQREGETSQHRDVGGGGRTRAQTDEEHGLVANQDCTDSLNEMRMRQEALQVQILGPSVTAVAEATSEQGTEMQTLEPEARLSVEEQDGPAEEVPLMR